MIHGRFVRRLTGARPAPYVDVDIRLDQQRGFVPIELLVDTGADFTTIGPDDARRLWPGYEAHDFGADSNLARIVGIGGGSDFVRRMAEVRFADDVRGVVRGVLLIRIAALQQADFRGFPSLLGRDLIGQLNLYVSETAGLVTLELPD